jgi:hypothetical protein
VVGGATAEGRSPTHFRVRPSYSVVGPGRAGIVGIVMGAALLASCSNAPTAGPRARAGDRRHPDRGPAGSRYRGAGSPRTNRRPGRPCHRDPPRSQKSVATLR